MELIPLLLVCGWVTNDSARVLYHYYPAAAPLPGTFLSATLLPPLQNGAPQLKLPVSSAPSVLRLHSLQPDTLYELQVLLPSDQMSASRTASFRTLPNHQPSALKTLVVADNLWAFDQDDQLLEYMLSQRHRGPVAPNVMVHLGNQVVLDSIFLRIEKTIAQQAKEGILGDQFSIDRNEIRKEVYKGYEHVLGSSIMQSVLPFGPNSMLLGPRDVCLSCLEVLESTSCKFSSENSQHKLACMLHKDLFFISVQAFFEFQYQLTHDIPDNILEQLEQGSLDLPSQRFLKQGEFEFLVIDSSFSFLKISKTLVSSDRSKSQLVFTDSLPFKTNAIAFPKNSYDWNFRDVHLIQSFETLFKEATPGQWKPILLSCHEGVFANLTHCVEKKCLKHYLVSSISKSGVAYDDIMLWLSQIVKYSAFLPTLELDGCKSFLSQIFFEKSYVSVESTRKENGLWESTVTPVFGNLQVPTNFRIYLKMLRIVSILTLGAISYILYLRKKPRKLKKN